MDSHGNSSPRGETVISKLVVVMPTHRRPELLARTLRSLASCAKPQAFARTIVVENGGKHGAEEVVRHADSSLKTEYRFYGWNNKSAALNSVLETVKDCLLVFFDDDIRFATETLCAYARAAEGMDCGRFFGGPTGVDYEEPPPEWLRARLPASARGFALDPPPDVVKWPQFFLGFNWAAFSQDLKRCGGFNAAYGPEGSTVAGGQDSSIQETLCRLGTVGHYLPDAMVWHYVPKERCSPQWAHQRTYRGGISVGIHAAQSPEVRAKWLAFPRAAQRMLRKRLSKRDMLAMVHCNQDGRFVARSLYSFLCGFMKGYRIGVRDDGRDPQY